MALEIINTLAANLFEFTTNRLSLREVSLSDLDNIHALHSLPEVDEFNTLGIPDSIEETRKFIEPFILAQKVVERKSYFWVISEIESNEFVGIAGMTLSRDKFKLGEIYYKLIPSKWGIGYATEVARALVKYGFDEFHLHKIEAGVATENKASIKVLEKAGMIREGRRRKILPIRGEWVDNYHYAIVEDDIRNY